MTIRSKHRSLLNYFMYDRRDLSPAYVKSCEKFFKSLEPRAAARKLQASSGKLDNGTGIIYDEFRKE